MVRRQIVLPLDNVWAWVGIERGWGLEKGQNHVLCAVDRERFVCDSILIQHWPNIKPIADGILS